MSCGGRPSRPDRSSFFRTMLQKIRDRITGKIALAFLALIALPFVFFGIDYNFIGLGYAAKVNGEEVSINMFENAYRNQLLALAEQGQEVPEELRTLVREGVLDTLIREELVLQYLRESGYRIPDTLVSEAIQSEPTWQEDGAFSPEAYYTWLEQRAITAAEFEENQRRFLEQNQLRRGIALTAFVTPAEYRRYLNLYGEQRQVAIAEIDVTALSEAVEVTDEDVQAYYDSRPDAFLSPESVDFQYVELSRSGLAETLEITEDELQRYYEQAGERFVRDEQRQARHILIPFGDDEAAAEAEAAALTARASAGEPFEDLARQYSKDGGTAPQGGDLGLLLKSQLPVELGDAIFVMEQGDVEGPVRSTFGFHVIRLDDIQSGGPMPLSEIRNELIAELRADKVEAVFQEKERDLSNALFDAANVESLAATVGLPLSSVSGFERSGGGPFGGNQAAIDAVFDERVLVDREVSDLVEIDADRTVVIGVSDYREAARRPLDEVAEDIARSIRSERAFALASERVSELRAALADGSNFDDAASGVEGFATRTVSVTRQSQDVDSRLRAAVFQEKKPAAGTPRVGTVVTAGGNYAVYSVTAYAPGRPESIPLAERDAMKEQLAVQSGSQDFASFVRELELRADIAKSEDALAADSFYE